MKRHILTQKLWNENNHFKMNPKQSQVTLVSNSMHNKVSIRLNKNVWDCFELKATERSNFQQLVNL